MLLALWNYLRGYVIIRVSGFSVERFVNLASHKGIYLWDICYDKTCVTMSVSISGFKMLKQCSKKTGCYYRILEKHGLPFLLHKYKKRKLLEFGVLFFIVFLYILSSFVWTVDIQGIKRINENDLLNLCYEYGLKPGKLKKDIDTENITQALIQNVPDIAWISIVIKGTEAKINIVETIEKSQIVDRKTPCDIIAKKDGIIVSVATAAGTPIVKAGDVVEKGDLLISGKIEIKDGDQPVGEDYIQAEAAVSAKLWYNFNDNVSLQYDKKVYTGESKTDKSVIFFDNIVNFIKPNIKYDNYDTEILYEKNAFIGDYELPIGIKEEVYKEYYLEPKERSIEEAQNYLKDKIDEKILENIDDNSEIIDIDMNFVQDGNNIVVNSVVTVIERIDEKVNIQNFEQTENGGVETDGAE